MIGYQHYDRSYFPSNFYWLACLLQEVHPRASRLLDIGCATGSFLVVSRGIGLVGSGSELVEEAAEVASQHGFRVVPGPFDASDWSEEFDVVTALEVLEHVQDLRSFLRDARSVVAADGIFCFLIPNIDQERIVQYGDKLYEFSRSLEHTYYFNKPFVEVMCREIFAQGALTAIAFDGGDNTEGSYILGIVRERPIKNPPEARLARAMTGEIDGLTTDELRAVALTAGRFRDFRVADRALAKFVARDPIDADLVQSQLHMHKGHLHEAFRTLWPAFERANESGGSLAGLQVHQLLTAWLLSHDINANPRTGFCQLDRELESDRRSDRAVPTVVGRGERVPVERSSALDQHPGHVDEQEAHGHDGPAGANGSAAGDPRVTSVAELRRDVSELESAVERAEEQLAAREAELAEIFASRAWSVVRFLRAAKRGAQGGDALLGIATQRLRGLAAGRAVHQSDGGRGELGDIPPPSEHVVSVVIPVFNKGAKVLDALESVRGQTLESVEIVIWDDGSTEAETLNALKEIERAAFPAVTVFHGPNRGVSGARNAGIAASRGYYVCCLDADDKLEPTYLEKAVSILSSDPSVGLAYSWVGVRGDRTGTWRTQDLDPSLILKGNQVPTCAVMRREVVRETGGFRTDMQDGFEDWELWAHAARLGFGGRVIEEELFEYQYSDDPATSLDARARADQDRILGFIRSLHASDDVASRARRSPVLDPTWWATARRRYRRGSRRPVIVAVPWFTVGGADLILEELIRHWRACDRTVVVIATQALGKGMASRMSELLKNTPYAYSLPDLLPSRYWQSFVVGISRSLEQPTLLIQGSRWAYENLHELRARVPDMRVVDKHFNEVGHFESSLRARELIDLTVTCNRTLQAEFVRAGWRQERTTAIYDNVAFEPHRLDRDQRARVRDRLGMPRNGWIVLYVGRLSAEKRPGWALDLADRLADEGVSLLIVGDGPLGGDVQSRLRRRPNVRWLRAVDRDRLAEIYGAADVLVVPSITEGVPLTLLEAVSAGLPVVATNVGGMVEFDGEPGIRLVGSRDFEAFVRAVARSLAHPEAPHPPKPRYHVRTMTEAWDRVLDLDPARVS
jgi:glycosyltransferase involved in cell wall biosynthesis/SAM-dependent methyltransferase